MFCPTAKIEPDIPKNGPHLHSGAIGCRRIDERMPMPKTRLHPIVQNADRGQNRRAACGNRGPCSTVCKSGGCRLLLDIKGKAAGIIDLFQEPNQAVGDPFGGIGQVDPVQAKALTLTPYSYQSLKKARSL